MRPVFGHVPCQSRPFAANNAPTARMREDPVSLPVCLPCRRRAKPAARIATGRMPGSVVEPEILEALAVIDAVELGNEALDLGVVAVGDASVEEDRPRVVVS